jgi:hypothetical protein
MLSEEQTKCAIITLLGLSAILLLLHVKQMTTEKFSAISKGLGVMPAHISSKGLTSMAAHLSAPGAGFTSSARLHAPMSVGTKAAYLHSVDKAQNALAAHLHATPNGNFNSIAPKDLKADISHKAKTIGSHIVTAVRSTINPNTGRAQSGELFGMKRK